MQRTLAILASVAALWGSVGSTAAQAAAVDVKTSYATVMTQTQPLALTGGLPGKLILTVSGDGIVNGWYIPDAIGSFIPVTGGKAGDQIWFDVGANANVRVDGTVRKDGSIVGSATQLGRGLRPAQAPLTFSFVATPKATD